MPLDLEMEEIIIWVEKWQAKPDQTENSQVQHERKEWLSPLYIYYIHLHIDDIYIYIYTRYIPEYQNHSVSLRDCSDCHPQYHDFNPTAPHYYILLPPASSVFHAVKNTGSTWPQIRAMCTKHHRAAELRTRLMCRPVHFGTRNWQFGPLRASAPCQVPRLGRPSLWWFVHAWPADVVCGKTKCSN